MSALDAASELEILCTWTSCASKWEFFSIAHWLAAVASADVVYVFDEGRAVESGTWNALMVGRGQLYALAEAQGLVRVAVNAGR